MDLIQIVFLNNNNMDIFIYSFFIISTKNNVIQASLDLIKEISMLNLGICLFEILKDRKNIWARSCENVSYAICEQQRCRSACASAQSDQHLYCSLLR